MTKLKETKIDVVITWVDGNDPILKQKRNNYIRESKRSITVNPTQFTSVNEIKYCVLSILKFAPFVRNIFIITDGQDPKINDDIKVFYPERLSSIKIIDHKEVFRGYEQYLPTFNCRPIETLLWRVKDLSENFVYFNDDMFLVNKIKPEDWFINGRPVIRGKWKSKPSFLLLRKKILSFLRVNILKRENANLKPTHKVSQYFSALKIGYKKKYFRVDHTPHPINKTCLEKFFTKNEKFIESNLKYKFRNYNQFNMVSLANHLEIKNGNTNIKSHVGEYVYLMPYNRDENYTDTKINSCSKESVKFICAQSLDIAKKEDREKILFWLDKKTRKSD